MKKLLFLGLVALLVISLPLSFFGCAGLTDEQIVAKVVDVSNSIKSLKLGMNISADIEVTGGNQPGKMTFVEAGTGSVNNTTKEMLMNIKTDADIPSVGKQTVIMNMYLTGGFMYAEANVAGQDQWMKMKIDQSQWDAQNQFAQEIELLKSSTSISTLPDEKINGFDCYVFQVTPDMATLMKWVQSQQSNTTELQNINPDMFKTTTLKYWIDKKSLLPQKADINLTIEMTPADLGATSSAAQSFDKMTITMTGEVTCSDYNVPVTIQLPAAAQNAQETQLNQ